MSRIRVTIDRLTLNGIEPSDRQPLVEGLQAELSRLLANPVNRAKWADAYRTPVLRLGCVPLETGPTGSRKFGKGVARAIGGGVEP